MRALALNIILVIAGSGCEKVPFPFSEGRNVVLDFPVLQRHWDPETQTVYILAQGSEADLHRHSEAFELRTGLPDDPRFRYTTCSAPWWTPPASPKVMLVKATIDHPKASPDAVAEYEFVITADKDRVYYEQRTLPLRSDDEDTPHAPPPE